MYNDPEKKFDIRVVEKNLWEGVVTSQDYDGYLQSLPDVSSNIDEEYTISLYMDSNQNEDEGNLKNFSKET